MMKKHFLLVALFLATISCASILFFQSKEKVTESTSAGEYQNQLESNIIAQQDSERVALDLSEKPLRDEYQFVVSILTEMRSEATLIGEVDYRFNMALKPVSEGSEQLMGRAT